MQLDKDLCKANIHRCDCLNGGRKISHYFHQLGCDYLIWYASEVDKLEFKADDDPKRTIRKWKSKNIGDES